MLYIFLLGPWVALHVGVRLQGTPGREECTTLWDEPEWALHYQVTTYRPCMSVASHSVLFVSTPCCVLLLWWWDSLQETTYSSMLRVKICHVQVLQSAVTKITVGSNCHWWVCTRWADGCWYVKPLRNWTVLASCLFSKGWLCWTRYTN